MNASSIPWNALLEGLIVLAALGLILYRQLQWREVARMQRLGGILSVVGAVMVLQQLRQSQIEPVTLGYLVLTAVFAVGAGLVMGLVSTVRTGADGSLEMRGGWGASPSGSPTSRCAWGCLSPSSRSRDRRAPGPPG